MAKRGRPPKNRPPEITLPPLIPAKRGRPRKTEPSLDEIWASALKLAATISDHYSMRPSEQKLALAYSLILDRGATLVELGVTHGRTAAILCYAAMLKGFHYYGIDNFSIEGDAETTKANLAHLGLPFNLLAGDTTKVSWNKTIDYLLIDAGHDVVNITQDCQRWLPYVSPGGLVVFHDYNPNIDQSDPHWGIKWSVDHYCQNWQTIDCIEWLIIKRKPLT
jgi:predicted O-methyltransferase YrrM